MLIEALMDMLYGLFELLTVGIEIVTFPQEFTNVFLEGLNYLKVGLQVLGNYVDLTYLLLLFGLVMAVDLAMSLYKFVMWILRKIPMLGIK